MTIAETAKIMAILETAYPAFYSKASAVEKASAAKLWQMVFDQEPYQVVQMSVLSLIKNRTNTFPPVPGEVSEKIQELTQPKRMTEMEAWGIVQKALRNSLYGYEEEFAKLPAEIQKTVGSANTLREWALMPADEVHTVVSSNFQRSYKVAAKRQQELNALPGSVKEFLAIATDRVAKQIGDGT